MQVKRVCFFLALVFCSAALYGQEYPKYEAFVGYSHVRPGIALGWDVSGAYNMNRWAGLKVDADGHYFNGRSETRFTFLHQDIHDVLVGPQFSWRTKPGTLFGHVLVGYSRFTEHFAASLPSSPFPTPSPIQISANGFALVIGGGGDINLGRRWAWRLQADELQAERFSTWATNFRFATGVVLRFGLRK